MVGPGVLVLLRIDQVGTLITIAAAPCKEVLTPIYGRLEDEQGILRRSADVSMLAQALLDVGRSAASFETYTDEACSRRSGYRGRACSACLGSADSSVDLTMLRS
jgi:hypothetical protein